MNATIEHLTAAHDFSVTLNEVAASIHTMAREHYLTDEKGNLRVGDYFYIEGERDGAMPNSSAVHKLFVEYTPLPLYAAPDTGLVGERPILVFEFDAIGELQSFGYWVDNNNALAPKYQFRGGPDGIYKEDYSSDVKDQESETIDFRRYLGLLGGASLVKAENELANYLLEKEMLQTGLDVPVDRFKKLTQWLHRAQVDITYID